MFSMTFRFASLFLVMGVASASSMEEGLSPKHQILSGMKEGIDPLQTTLQNDFTSTQDCFGETASPSATEGASKNTASLDSGNCAARHLKATVGNKCTCSAACSTRPSPAWVVLGLTFSSAEQLPTSQLFKGDNNTNGCTGGLQFEVTSDSTGYLYAVVFSNKGISSGSLTCSETCVSSTSTIYQKMKAVFGLGNDGGNRRRLQKFIRGRPIPE